MIFFMKSRMGLRPKSLQCTDKAFPVMMSFAEDGALVLALPNHAKVCPLVSAVKFSIA